MVMKLTQSQLRKLIKEEIGAAVREGEVIDMSQRRTSVDVDPEEEAYQKLTNYMADMMEVLLDGGMPAEKISSLASDALKEAKQIALDEF